MQQRPRSIFWVHLLTTIAYVAMGLGFLISILVRHGVVSLIYFDLGAPGNVAISVLDSGAMCCSICFIYALFSALVTFKKNSEEMTNIVRGVDGIFVPLLYTNLAGFSDIIQIMSLFNMYFLFRFWMVSWLRHARILLWEDKVSLNHMCGAFWGTYIIAVGYGAASADHAGVITSQVFSLAFAAFDAYIIYAITRGRVLEELNASPILHLAEFSARVIALICVFVKAQ